MADPIYLFIDFDDTLSDWNEHQAQFVRELASLLAGDFGGEASAWGAALPAALAASRDRYAERFVGDPLAGYRDWIVEERARLASALFGAVGVALPDREAPDSLAKRMAFDALTYCNAAFPGAEPALRELFEAGVRTQLASAQDSEYLLGALIGAGVESYTESKFGPDLVDCAKEGPEFYRRIFEASGIRPSQAIVVDDQAMCLDWAEETGAKVVQARLTPTAPEAEFPITLTSLTDLPTLVKRLAG